MSDFIQRQIEIHTSVTKDLTKEAKTIEKVCNVIKKKIKSGGKLVIFGNGGSAADSQHMAAELIGHFKKKRNPIPAISLTTNTSNLTAISNDYSFEAVFERQVNGIVNSNDVVIGISTSGNSVNVLKGIKASKRIGAITVGLTGKKGSKLKQASDFCISVPSSDTQRIQECHILLIHIICALMENDK